MLKWGYNSTSIGDIARATDTSKATFYHHFDSKEDMLNCAVSEALTTNNLPLIITLGVELALQESHAALVKSIKDFLFWDRPLTQHFILDSIYKKLEVPKNE